MSQVDVLILRADGSAPELQKWQRDPDSEVEELTFEALTATLGDFESFYLCENFDIYVSEFPEPTDTVNTLLPEALRRMNISVNTTIRGTAVVHLREGCPQLAAIKEWLEAKQ
jgi:predicted phosphatase